MNSCLWKNYEKTMFIFIEEKKMKVYITGDHHFCHANIIKYCNRPFSSVEEMNEQMTELWKALPKKMMYQTFCLIIDYLEQSGKIMIDKDGRIIWTWNPKMIKKMIASGVKIR